MRLLTVVVIVFPILMLSCKSQQPAFQNYLQHVDTLSNVFVNLPDPHIQKNDLLSVKVYSQSADPRTDLPYNLTEPSATGGSAATGSTGFLVDEGGNIDYPQIGTLHVEGLTKSELAQLIRNKLAHQLKEPSVIVRFLNFKVTVLGEVKAPGTFTIPTERVTVLEALGLAGDITEFGKHDTIKIARERNGQVELGYVDLTSGILFQSPYYRLQQNDVVFVEQTRKRVQQQDRQAVAQQVAIISSIVTAVALIINIIR